MESVINDYISHEIAQDPALLPLSICAYLRAREPVRQEAAHG
jgi:hypothetical protein